MCLHYDDNYSTPEAGSLLTSGINGGSMLYLNQEYDDPFQYDLKFKETCCGLAQQCRSYYTRRPYTGRFCEEDHDGCSAVQCYVESTCRDVPAPGVGAECGACPSLQYKLCCI